ncbi:MAG: hypothetical protein IJ666_05840 [Ruminococcus sp.]|nr:hypothetical protein [Ruminococcus sp.]
MFYSQLIRLCKKEGVKPTPLIKSLGFSAGNIKRWENGATVNSDILLAVSEHFKVSIDYLLKGDESSECSSEHLSNSNNVRYTNGIEKEALRLFRTLPEEEQLKLIGRMEALSEIYKTEENTV